MEDITVGQRIFQPYAGHEGVSRENRTAIQNGHSLSELARSEGLSFNMAGFAAVGWVNEAATWKKGTRRFEMTLAQVGGMKAAKAGKKPKSVETLHLAALPFEVKNAPELKYLALALPEVIASQLSQLAKVELVERIHINKVLKEQAFQLGDLVDEGEQTEVGKLKGANALLIGSCTKAGDGGNLLITARIVLAKSGEILATADLVTSASMITQAPFQLGQALAARLKGEKTDPTKVGEDILLPKGEAFEAFGKGLEKEFEEQYQEALALFDKALQKDPTFTPVHSGLQRSATAVPGSELYKQALLAAVKKNKETLEAIREANEYWEAAQRFIKALKQSQPTASVRYESEVGPAEVSFKLYL